MRTTFLHFRQLDAMDCGPTCLRMITKYYGRHYSLQTLRENAFITHSGVSMMGISDAAEKIGFRNTGVRILFLFVIIRILKIIKRKTRFSLSIFY